MGGNVTADASSIGEQLGNMFPKDVSFMRLPNLGQTCYANSLMQCLLNSRYVCGFLDDFSRAIRRVPLDEKMQQSPLFQFVQLYNKKKLVKSKQAKVLDPSEFLESCRSALPQFVLGHQHDSHEMFVCLLAVFDETIEDINAKHGTDIPLFSSLFAGHSVTRSQCLICGETYETTEDFTNFYFSVERRESLVSRLKKAQQPEFLSGEGKRWCKNCRFRQEMEANCRYDRIPKVAMFQLQRFHLDADMKPHKLLGHVPFPSVLTLNKETYELTAVCIHSGLHLTSGHFTALLRVRERWVLANDANLSVLDSDKVEEMFAAGPTEDSLTTAYLLFYEAMDASA